MRTYTLVRLLLLMAVVIYTMAYVLTSMLQRF